MEFRKLKESFWEFSKDGKAKFKGNSYQPKNNKIEYNGKWLEVQFIIDSLFKDMPKVESHVQKQTAILEHGNKGRTLSDSHKKAISDKNAKSIVIDGITYKSLSDASIKLNRCRQTIYQYLKRQKLLQT